MGGEGLTVATSNVGLGGAAAWGCAEMQGGAMEAMASKVAASGSSGFPGVEVGRMLLIISKGARFFALSGNGTSGGGGCTAVWVSIGGACPCPRRY